jgi:hypothetical protein
MEHLQVQFHVARNSLTAAREFPRRTGDREAVICDDIDESMCLRDSESRWKEVKKNCGQAEHVVEETNFCPRISRSLVYHSLHNLGLRRS